MHAITLLLEKNKSLTVETRNRTQPITETQHVTIHNTVNNPQLSHTPTSTNHDKTGY